MTTLKTVVNTQNTPQLKAPGQGLPWLEALVSRWVVFPLVVLMLKPSKAIDWVQTNGQQVLAIAQGLTEMQRTTPVLIPKILGIEDSSRYWSVAMTIEHLLITGEGMAVIIESLAHGQPLDFDVKIENVKPKGEDNEQTVMARYQAFLTTYLERMQVLTNLTTSSTRHTHPWFWEMTAQQWLCLNGLHHHIHLNQIKHIVHRLPSS